MEEIGQQRLTLQSKDKYVNVKLTWALHMGIDTGLFFFIFFLTLQYCISFAKYRNESTTGIPMFPILNPPPSSLPYPPSGSSQCTSPKHPVPCIEPGLATHTWYYTCFNAILPNLPTLSLSHRVHKTDLYIGVSFAVSYTGILGCLRA